MYLLKEYFHNLCTNLPFKPNYFKHEFIIEIFIHKSCDLLSQLLTYFGRRRLEMGHKLNKIAYYINLKGR